MILETLDELRQQQAQPALVLKDYRTADERAGLQPLDVRQWALEPWAKWVAADSMGLVWQYEIQPERLDYVWDSDYDSRISILRVGTIDMTGIDWRQTLTPVNQEAAAPIASPAIPGEVAIIDRPEDAVVWHLSQMAPEALEAVAQQLASDDGPKAEFLADAIYCALDAKRKPVTSRLRVRLIDVLMAGTATEGVEA